MNNGFSFQDSMKVAVTKTNTECIHLIESEMESGMQGEDILIKYMPLQYQGYFDGFMQYMSCKDSLASVLEIVQSERKQKEEIIKGMLYPTLLLLGVNIGVLIFDWFVLPVMTKMMAGFQVQDPSLFFLQNLIHFLSVFVLTAFCMTGIGLIYLLQPSRIVLTYHTIQKFFPESLIVKYASSQFSRFYLECLHRHISTRSSLQILKQMDRKPFVKEIASQLDVSLQQGQEMSQAIANAATESALNRIFHISVYASNCEAMMEGYLKMVKDRTSREIQRYARIVQCLSYCSVGMVILSVYQVLLMPIRMMQNL